LTLYLRFKASFADKCSLILASEDVTVVDGACGKSPFDFQFQIIQFLLKKGPLVEILFNHDATALHVVEII